MKEVEAFFAHWLRGVLCTFVGALLGIVLSLWIPKQYDATAHLTVTIDYNKTGTLDELAQDRLIGGSEDIIHSDAVLSAACGETESCTADSLQDKIRITRTLETWTLSVRDSNPTRAAETALNWQRAAYDALWDAHEHAVKADAAQKRLDAITECLQEPGCPDAESLPAEIDTLSAEIRSENEAAHGLSSAIRIGSLNPSGLELRSASRSTAVGALLGALVGLIFAFALVWLPERKPAGAE